MSTTKEINRVFSYSKLSQSYTYLVYCDIRILFFVFPLELITCISQIHIDRFFMISYCLNKYHDLFFVRWGQSFFKS